MTSHLHLLIIDSPLVNNKSPRTAMVEKMARLLALIGDTVNSDEASREVLRAWGFRMADITMCIDDARQAAFSQTSDIVAREMAKP